MLHWLQTAFNTYVLHSMHGNGYQWSSGPGANFGEIPLFGVAVAWWHHVNCGAPRCFRIGRHPTADGLHHLCRKHHPDLPSHRLSLLEIHARHHQAKGGR